ncbi:MAG: tetratricopeptide repeat protein [Elusimicrobiota bacterium]|nr:MAG: tetratricopeptide repeat protein [Elusimicrobiota bacterium]
MSLSPWYDRHYWWRGVINTREGRVGEAIADLTAAIRRLPEMSLFYLDRAEAFLKAGRWTELVADLSTAADMDYKLTGKVADLGAAELLAGVRRAEAADPKDHRAPAWTGFLLMRAGNYAEAAAALERSIALDSSWAWPHAWLAQVALHSGRADRALSLLDEAGRRRAEHPEDRYWRGAALLQLGRRADAGAELDRCLALDPKNDEARSLRETLR